MSKPIILAIGGEKAHGISHLIALYAREKVVNDMYTSAKSEKEKDFYKHELEDIRAEIDNITVCD